MPDKTTAKVAPRSGEDTDKVKSAFDIAALVSKAKSNPWVLVVLALGGGTGTQEVLAQLGQNVQWWWVAIAVAGYGMLQYMSDSAKRQEKVRETLSEIKTQLKLGTDRFEHIEREVRSLHDWRKEVVQQQVAAATSERKPRKGGSEVALKPA